MRSHWQLNSTRCHSWCAQVYTSCVLCIPPSAKIASTTSILLMPSSPLEKVQPKQSLLSCTSHLSFSLSFKLLEISSTWMSRTQHLTMYLRNWFPSSSQTRRIPPPPSLFLPLPLTHSHRGGHSPSYIYRQLAEYYHPSDYSLWYLSRCALKCTPCWQGFLEFFLLGKMVAPKREERGILDYFNDYLQWICLGVLARFI